MKRRLIGKYNRLRGHIRGDELHARIGQADSRLAEMDERLRHAEARLANLEATALSLPQLDARYAPVLWQNLGRQPLPALDPVLAHARAAAGESPEAIGTQLAERAATAAIGTRAGVSGMAALGPEGLYEHAAADTAPLPTPDDRVGYYGDDHVGYWLSGLCDALYLAEVAERYGAPLEPGTAFLDFGCASGRVLRHVERLHPQVTVWGADLTTALLDWARTHLPNRIRLLQGTLVPSLPLPDASLDVVFAGSVFTHVAEFEEALLDELVRVLRPGGLLLASIHPERAWENLGNGSDLRLSGFLTENLHRAEPIGVEPVTIDLFREPMPADRVVVSLTTYPINNHFTFHTRRWLEQRWGAHHDIVDVIEHGHGQRQDLVVLRA